MPEVVEAAVVTVPQLHAQEGLLVHHHHHEEAVHALDGPHPHPVQKSVKDLHQRASEIERFEAKSSQQEAWLTEVSGWPVSAMAQGHEEHKEPEPDHQLAPGGRRILRQKALNHTQATRKGQQEWDGDEERGGDLWWKGSAQDIPAQLRARQRANITD